MAIARFQMPDGRIARFEVPEGTTPEQAQQIMTAHFAREQPAQAAQTPTAGDRVNAVATGVNRGAFTRLAGLPVDTVTNVLDLLKAGAGSAYIATTGKAPPEFLEPADRSQVIGSGDWIERKVRENGGGSVIDPSGPSDPTQRVLHNLGMGVGGAIGGGRLANAPMTNAAMARNAGLGGMSGGAGAIATEGGASPAVAVLASMVPQAASAAIAGGARHAVRGGEDGRRRMEQRMRDLQDAGIDNPSLGLASGNAFIAGLENLASKVPGSVGLYNDHRARMIEGMMNKAASARDLASNRSGTDVAGTAIQADLQTLLKQRVTGGFERVNDDMVSLIPGQQRFPITNSLAALASATSANPLAQNTTSSFVQPRIAALRENMLLDTQEAVPSVYGARTINKGLPVAATRDIRTSIGKEAASRSIMGTPEQAEFKQVYGGLTRDIGNAARLNDLAMGPQPNNVGPTERSFNRGNKLYSAGMERIAQVQPFASKGSPEQAYNAFMQSGKENVSTFRAVKKSVSEETRATVAATAIDRMGKAKPGQQNEAGDVWSQETFLTNWNQMAPKARKELLSGFPNASKVYDQVEALAKGASMIRDSSKIWANPSGTGGNTLAAGTFGGIAASAFVDPVSSLAALGGLGAARVASQNLLLNPQVSAAIARQSTPYNELADLFPITLNADEARRKR